MVIKQLTPGNSISGFGPKIFEKNSNQESCKDVNCEEELTRVITSHAHMRDTFRLWSFYIWILIVLEF